MKGIAILKCIMYVFMELSVTNINGSRATSKLGNISNIIVSEVLILICVMHVLLLQE